MKKLLILFLIALFTNSVIGQQQGNSIAGGHINDPGQNQFPMEQRTTSAIRVGGPTIPSGNKSYNSTTLTGLEEIRQCIANCPTTPEYNPVCGSDNVTYTNPGRLICAKACGVNVTIWKRESRCVV